MLSVKSRRQDGNDEVYVGRGEQSMVSGWSAAKVDSLLGPPGASGLDAVHIMLSDGKRSEQQEKALKGHDPNCRSALVTH